MKFLIGVFGIIFAGNRGAHYEFSAATSCVHPSEPAPPLLTGRSFAATVRRVTKSHHTCLGGPVRGGHPGTFPPPIIPLSAGRQPSAFADRPASPSPTHRIGAAVLGATTPTRKWQCQTYQTSAGPRVKKRLQAELGDAIYTSWFARMELREPGPRHRPHQRAHPVPQELDPVPLQRAAADLLAVGAADRAAHRPFRAIRDPHSAALRLRTDRGRPGREARDRPASPTSRP